MAWSFEFASANENRIFFPDDELWYDVRSDEPEYIHLDPTGSATLSLSGPKTMLSSIRHTLAITFALKLDGKDIFTCPGALNNSDSYTVGDEHFATSTVLFFYQKLQHARKSTSLRVNSCRRRPHCIWGSGM